MYGGIFSNAAASSLLNSLSTFSSLAASMQWGKRSLISALSIVVDGARNISSGLPSM